MEKKRVRRGGGGGPREDEKRSSDEVESAITLSNEETCSDKQSGHQALCGSLLDSFNNTLM